MKYFKVVALIILALVILSFALFKDFEFARDPSWPETITVYSNPVTNRIRVVDSEDNTTLFYYPVDGFAKPVSFQKSATGWTVTFVKQ